MAQLIVIIISIIFFDIVTIYYWLRVPKNLKHIPSTSAIDRIINTLKHAPIDVKIKKISTERLRKTKIQTFWKFGEWGVTTSSPQVAKRLFNDTITFPKILPLDIFPGSLFVEFLGTNLALSNHGIWKRQRSVLNPPFKKQFDPEIFANCTREFFGLVDEKISGNEIDIYKYMQRITMDALGKGIMGVDFNSVTKDEVYFISAYNKLIKEGQNPIFLLFRKTDKEWNPWRKEAFQTLKGFKEYFKDIIESKRKKLAENPALAEVGNVDTDILNLMVQASQDEDIHFSEKEIIDNVMAFVLAGHDTTAFALSAALHFIAQNPRVQDLARKEVIQVMGLDDYYRGNPENCPAPDAEQAKQMVYLMAIMKESMRLYPSVTKLPTRRAAKEVEFEGYTIPAGTPIELDIFSMHRDPDNFSKLEEFIPERFLEGDINFSKAEQAFWTPFGGGTRSCIGVNFSLLEQKVVLAMILLRYSINYPQSYPQSNGAPLLLKFYALSAPDNLHLNLKVL